MKVEMKRALVFSVLMQNIMETSPDYLMEKWEAVKDADNPELLLDSHNLRLCDAWRTKWGQP